MLVEVVDYSVFLGRGEKLLALIGLFERSTVTIPSTTKRGEGAAKQSASMRNISLLASTEFFSKISKSLLYFLFSNVARSQISSIPHPVNKDAL